MNIFYLLLVSNVFNFNSKVIKNCNTIRCNIVINTNVNKNTIDTFSLYTWGNDSLIANISIKGGTGIYEYEGNWRYLYVKSSNSNGYFVVDTSTIEIEINKNLNNEALIKGGMVNSSYKELLNEASQRFNLIRRINSRDSLSEFESKKLDVDKTNFVSWFMKSIHSINDSGLMSLILLNNQIYYLKVFYSEIKPNDIEDILNFKKNISPIYTFTSSYKKLDANLKQILYLKKGNDISDFNLVNVYGDTISTLNFRGKFLLVDFWATWCTPCKKENEIYRQKYDNWSKQKLAVLGVLVFSDSNTWMNIVKNLKYDWNNVFCNDKKVMETYSIQAIPKSILFSPKGKILAINPTSDEIDKLILE